ncbi:hypothetical protein [Actinoplanes sp. NPDC049316]|uniref:hypothetical protein n=1 Tax=Actinoplanes sp. NPDC049316 TaxID=3154727 RepID=UPI00341F86E0
MSALLATSAHARLLVRSRIVLAINAGAAIWIVGQVLIRTREATGSVTFGDILADLTDGVRVASAVAATASAALLIGAHSQSTARHTLYLAAARRRDIVGYGAGACFLMVCAVLCLACALGLAASLFIRSAVPVAAMPVLHPAVATTSVDLALTLVIGSALWTLFGAALGTVVGSRSAGTAAALLFFATGEILERTAVTYPAVRAIWQLSPWGAANVVLTGRGIPDFPQSSANPAVGFACFVVWVLLLCAATRLRFREGAGRRKPSSATARSVPRRAAWLVGLPPVAAAMIAGGWLVPPLAARQVPWQYTFDWRHDVAAHLAPADVTRDMVDNLRESGKLDQRYFAAAGYRQARQYVAQLKSLDPGHEIFDVTGADRPGEVAILPSSGNGEELVACLNRDESGWRIIAMRPNLQCKDFADGW